MNKTKRLGSIIISLLLALALTAGMIPAAFAAEAAPAAEKQEDCIRWEVSFDKKSYFLFDKPTVTVKFTNTSDKDLLAVFSADSEAFECLSSETGELKILKAGKSETTKMQLQLSSNAPGINFFARLLLKIRDLFKKGSALKAEGTAGSSFEAQADFGWDGKQPVKFALDYGALELDAAGTDSNRGQKFFEDMLGKNAYTMKFVMSSTADGKSTSMPVTIAKDGDNMYIEATAPIDIDKDAGTMTIKAYIKGDKARIYVPDLKAYMDLPSDQVKDFIDEFKLGVEAPENNDYKGSAGIKIGGKNYNVDVYENENGTSYYYYDGQDLKIIENEDKDGTVSVIEITQVSDSADSKLFNEPSGYSNITDLLSQDGMENWF